MNHADTGAHANLSRRRATPLGDAEGYAMPGHKPYYGPLPTYYRQVAFQLLFFQAEPARLQSFVPAPLTVSPSGRCVAFALHVPDSTSYGAFNESGIQIEIEFQGQIGFFNSHLYLDNVPAICAGRERWGAPKQFAQISLGQHGNLRTAATLTPDHRAEVSTPHVGAFPIFQMTTETVAPIDPREIPPIFPSYRLKLIPRADGPGPAIKQLITAAPQDVTVHDAATGWGTVQFGATAHNDLRPFGPVAEAAAYFYTASYTETYGEIAHDYLQHPA